MTNGKNVTYETPKKMVKKNNPKKLQLDHYRVKSLVDKNISASAIYRVVQINLSDKLTDTCKKVKINGEFPNKKLGNLKT